MRKLAILLVLCFSAAIWAQTTCAGCTVSITPDATVHNGAAPGDPAGYIDGNGKLDTTGMSGGDLICFDISLENFDFNLAGFQFEVNYPAFLTALSTNAADWNAGTGAVLVAGDVMPSGFLQNLPADNAGNLLAATSLQNGEGKFQVGVLVTDPSQRPQGSVGTPNAGGIVLKAWFTLNKTATCNSSEEGPYVKIGSSFSGPADDLFADDNANRVTVGSANIEALFGDTTALLRADANGDDARNAVDALGAANCSLNGEGGSGCPFSGTTAEFNQVFDYNCDGSVNAADALGNAKLALNLQNRTSFKNLEYMNFEESGLLTINYENRTGAMATATMMLSGIKVGAPAISQAAQDAGWVLIHERNSSTMQYILLNPGAGRNATIPTVSFEYKPVSKVGRIALAESFGQNADLTEFAYAPQMLTEDLGNNVRESIQRDVPKK